MIKENVTEGSSPVVETPTEVKTELPGLSTRDAIGVAIEEVKEREAAKVEAKAPIAPVVEKPVVTKPAYEAPGEWNKEEKEDFLTLSPKQQEATLRIHKNRQAKLEEIKRESADLQWAKDLAKEVEPYIKSVGGKKKAHEALIDALKMRSEFDQEDPQKVKAAAAAYLKAKGLDVPKDLVDAEGTKEKDPEIVALRSEMQEIKSRQQQEERTKVATTLSQSWNDFELTKNASGTARFPDLANPEKGPQLARSIGSLVDNVSQLSQQFIANAVSRIPDLTLPRLYEEAYRFLGGQVDDSSTAPRTQSQKKHIANASRASSSVPGITSHSSSSGVRKKYATNREAAAAALAELRANEGS